MAKLLLPLPPPRLRPCHPTPSKLGTREKTACLVPLPSERTGQSTDTQEEHCEDLTGRPRLDDSAEAGLLSPRASSSYIVSSKKAGTTVGDPASESQNNERVHSHPNCGGVGPPWEAFESLLVEKWVALRNMDSGTSGPRG